MVAGEMIGFLFLKSKAMRVLCASPSCKLLVAKRGC